MELLNPLDDAANGAKSAAYTGTAGATGTWPAGAEGVLVWCTSDAYVRVGEGVTATAADTPLPANTPVPFAVPPGSNGRWRVSALQMSAGGTLYAKPIGQ